MHPGVLRLGRARGWGSTRCSPGVDELLAGARGDPERRCLGPRVQDRAHGRRASASPTPACSPARSGRASASASAAARRRRRRRSGCSRRPARRGATTSRPGEMAAIRGLGAVRVGDAIGEPPPGQEETARFPRPALEAVVFAAAARASRARSARPSASSPSRIRSSTSARTTHRHEIAVSLYGEVQKEVIQATLERDYGIAADFRETTTVCIERPGAGRRGRGGHPGEERIRTSPVGARRCSTNPFTATLALRIEPAPAGLGDRVPARRRAAPRPALPVPDGRDVRGPDGGVRPRSAGRGPGRLAGDRLPGHDDRLRLRVTGDEPRPTSGG